MAYGSLNQFFGNGSIGNIYNFITSNAIDQQQQKQGKTRRFYTTAGGTEAANIKNSRIRMVELVNVPISTVLKPAAP